MDYMLDVQGFKQPVNEFVVKELAIVPLHENSQTLVFLFKPPQPWFRLSAKYKSTNSWLERNYHGLSWSLGEIPYNELENVLQNTLSNARTVYIKGQEKKQWLEQFSFHVCDLETLGFPSLQRLKYNILEKLCSHHKFSYKVHCAHRNVLILKKYYLNNMPSLERSFKIFFQTEHLSFMNPVDIAQLPKSFLITFGAKSIEQAWDKIPEQMKRDPEILACLRCREHVEKESFPPLRRDCIQCAKTS